MAASETQIVNIALAKIGQNRIENISDTEDAAARWAAELYPVARDYVTECGPLWRHAKITASLSEEATNDLEDDWDYAYTRPSDCFSLKYLLSESYPFDPACPIRFICEGDVIYTDGANARAVYIKQVTDVTRFPPSFTDAIAWYLAHTLVQPLRMENRFFADTLNGFQRAVNHAAAQTASEELYIKTAREGMSDWQRARG